MIRRLICSGLFVLIAQVVLSQNVEKLWDRTYGTKWGESGNTIVATSEGNLLVTGWVTTRKKDSLDFGTSDYLAIKLNLGGDLLWQKYYGGSSHDSQRFNSTVTSKNKGYIITGSSVSKDGDVTASYSCNGQMLWMIETDSAGSIEWNKRLGGGTR